ncbi:Scr1 family TA system antitoxin-like transcriptional regulator [Streptodolium elevatio]|uniref:Scr1 family TA system antitoxin-like transcriptional regulator n=1 Tax=Streptodolium elevatio TaxID=3157996 RepID=A0ABV3DPA5_9ACTN
MEHKVQQRMKRGEIFRKDHEVSLGFVVDEAAIRGVPKDDGLAAEQLTCRRQWRGCRTCPSV